jgi:predicted permease
MTRSWRRYLRLWRRNPAVDVDEELRFHLQERVDLLRESGLDEKSAREEALRGFGDLEQVKSTLVQLAEERETAMRRSEWFGALRQDVLFGLRQMRAHTALTVAIVLTLALGIGSTTALFSVVNAVLLRPLPYHDSDRLIIIWETIGNARSGRVAPGLFTDWSEQSKVLEGAAAWRAQNYNLTGSGDPERIQGARVTPRFFDVVYMPPAVGRYFRPDENADSRVVVLSNELWQTRFAGDRAIVGRQIMLNGEAHTVIGVTPAGYSLTDQDERLWTPFVFSPEQRATYGSHSFLMFARLKPSVTMTQAEQDILRIHADARSRNPEPLKIRGVRLESMYDSLVSFYRTQLWVLLGAVGFVLLIACGNVASLLLARALTRQKEIAIRGALGGGRMRIIRQLLTESIVLAFIGGLAGVGVARLGVRFLVGMGPSYVPRLQEAGLQPEVLGFALFVTLGCALLFGVAPALRATRVGLATVLQEGGRSGRGAIRDRVRATLVVGEIAFTLVLLVAAGLFIRSAQLLQRVPLGFDPDGVTMMRVSFPEEGYADAAALEAAFARVLAEVRSLPGIESAAAGTRVPLWGASVDAGYIVQGGDPEQQRPGHVRLITTDYFKTLGIALKRGRTLQESDFAAGAPYVVVINEAMAREVFGDRNPLGQRLSGWAPRENPEWREVVGVVSDVRAFGRDNDTPSEIFLPYTQAPDGAWGAFNRSMTVVARAQPGATIVPGLRAAVRRVDPLVPLFDVQPMNEVLAQSTAGRQFNMLLLTLLGATALVLATMGIYGVISFSVSQRLPEIALRTVLGATTSDVIVMVLRQGAVLAGLGILLGGAAAFWATRALRSLLFAVPLADAPTYASAALLLGGVAVIASLLPARRAARVEPNRSLVG